MWVWFACLEVKVQCLHSLILGLCPSPCFVSFTQEGDNVVGIEESDTTKAAPVDAFGGFLLNGLVNQTVLFFRDFVGFFIYRRLAVAIILWSIDPINKTCIGKYNLVYDSLSWEDSIC